MILHAIIEELVDLMEGVTAMLTGTQRKIAQVPKYYYILDHQPFNLLLDSENQGLEK